MSLNYNTRPRVVKVMVLGTSHQLMRELETAQDLFVKEYLLK